VAIEVAVLELHARPLRRLCDEPDLHLAGVALLRLQPPLRADVPAEDDPIRWFKYEDAGLFAHAPIGSTVIDVATNLRLEPGLGDLGTEEVVLRRLEVTEPLDERSKRTLDRRVTTTICRRTTASSARFHDPSSGGCSTRSWYPLNARCQNVSS
jgi:hypothetical protein